MSSNSSVATIDLRLAASMRGFRIVFWLHVIPLIAVSFAMPAGWTMMGVGFGFAASWLWLRRHAAIGFGPRAIVHLLGLDDGRWVIATALGQREEARLLPASVMQPGLIVLLFQTESGRICTRLILGDEADRNGLRRLRARLKLSTFEADESSREDQA